MAEKSFGLYRRCAGERDLRKASRPAKRSLYMTDPVLAFQRFHPGFKADWVSEFTQRTVETEISGEKRCRKIFQELSPE
jgi:hypothetical protein